MIKFGRVRERDHLPSEFFSRLKCTSGITEVWSSDRRFVNWGQQALKTGQPNIRLIISNETKWSGDFIVEVKISHFSNEKSIVLSLTCTLTLSEFLVLALR